MKQIGVGIIGTGWCGGIRAETCAKSPLVKFMDVSETRPERLAEIAKLTSPRNAVADYRQPVSYTHLTLPTNREV